MRFDSLEFLAFLCIVLLLERILPRGRGRLWLLLGASYLFYASWSPPFVVLLAFSTVLDFMAARWMAAASSTGRRRLFLGLSLAGNLGVLGFFKYGQLFMGVGSWLPWMPSATAFPDRADLIIPLGISFYTFQTLSYTIDVYRGRVEPCRDLTEFALFVSFFPQLIAGPVMRASELLPQIQKQPRATGRDVIAGVELFLLGLFKKVVIADNLAGLSDACFGDPGGYTTTALWLGALAYSGQIYCDFSGYSTMARGLGRLLGFHLPRNFDYPLLARNAWEFRQSWHITMSRWFQDYVYRPLASRGRGVARMSVNVVLTWTLFALWHGATVNFVMWGLFNGLLLAGYRLVRRPMRRWMRFRGSHLLSRAAMFGLLVPSLVLFRSPDLATSKLYFMRLVAGTSDGASVIFAWWGVFVGLALVHVASKLWYREDVLQRLGWTGRLSLTSVTVTLIALFSVTNKPFVYFQF